MPDSIATADELLAAAMAALDALAEAGDGVAGHAAAVLRGRTPEHQPIDDTSALAEVARLTRHGKGRSAASVVAAKMAATPAARHTIAQRLRRKLRKKNAHDGLRISKSVLSTHHENIESQGGARPRRRTA